MDFIKTVNHVYRDLGQQNINVPALVDELKSWFFLFPQYRFLHPCVIEGKASLVCHAQLSTLSPDAFSALSKITDQYAIFLKEDTRSANKPHASNRRTNAVVVLGFCLGIISTPVLSRESSNANLATPSKVTTQLIEKSNHISVQRRLKNGKQVISLRHVRPPSAEDVLNTYKLKKNLQTVDRQAEHKILSFLKQAYQYQAGDPPAIRTDLQKIASYYAQYPEVVELISELSTKNVQLKYKKGHWQAQALGTQYAVEKVTVLFDTRVGAQLWLQSDCKANPACNITPADALLHEFLHAKLMIVDSEQFIKNGGMKPTLYLFDHEKEVIEQENNLYSQMTKEDGLARPIRHRHNGNLLYASCALCVPGHKEQY